LGEAPKVYEALKEDYGEPKKTEAFFFGNHPRLSERIENSKRYAAAHTAAQATDRKPIDPDLFARRIRPVVREDARLNIRAGRLKIAEAELKKALAWMPEDPVTHLYLGRLRLAQAASAASEENGKDEAAERRLRAEAGDAFREAVRLGPDLPDAHRDLGHYLFEEKDYAHACGELRSYLDAIGPADPDRADSAEASGLAEDRERIQDIVEHLRQDGHCG
jgi:tetratricopeptide (TPR) repeat protein